MPLQALWVPNQRTAKGASGKGPCQKTSRSVKNIFRHFSTFFAQGKKRQKSSNIFFDTFDNFRAAAIFWPLLGASDRSEPHLFANCVSGHYNSESRIWGNFCESLGHCENSFSLCKSTHRLVNSCGLLRKSAVFCENLRFLNAVFSGRESATKKRIFFGGGGFTNIYTSLGCGALECQMQTRYGENAENAESPSHTRKTRVWGDSTRQKTQKTRKMRTRKRGKCGWLALMWLAFKWPPSTHLPDSYRGSRNFLTTFRAPNFQISELETQTPCCSASRSIPCSLPGLHSTIF